MIENVTQTEIPLSEHHSLTLHVQVSAKEAEVGLPKLRSALRQMRCWSVDVSHIDTNVTVTVTFEDEDEREALSEWIAEEIDEAFAVDRSTPADEFIDATFGKLTYHEEVSWFQGSCELPEAGSDIDLIIDSSSKAPNQASLNRAKELLDNWGRFEPKVFERICAELLDLYNTVWRPHDAKGDEALTADAFISRLSLYSLQIHDEQLATLRFDADEMFTEHGVTVTISSGDQIDAWME